MSADPARRLLAEAIGTGILVLFGAGSVVAALTLGGGELDYAGLGMVAITFALAIALAIYAFGNTSGAHLNPAVTVSLARSAASHGRRSRPTSAPSWPAALVGAALIWAAFGGDAMDLGMGQTSIADGTNYLQAIVAEAIGTFLLVTAIMALAVDRRAPGGWAGLMIGLAVAAAILLIGPAHWRLAQSRAHFRAPRRQHDRRRGHLLGRPAGVRDRAADRRRRRRDGLRRRRAAARISTKSSRLRERRATSKASATRASRRRSPPARGPPATSPAGAREPAVNKQRSESYG